MYPWLYLSSTGYKERIKYVYKIQDLTLIKSSNNNYHCGTNDNHTVAYENNSCKNRLHNNANKNLNKN